MEKSTSTHFSSLKSLFLCFLVERFFFFFIHLVCDGSNVSIEFLRGHLLGWCWGGARSSRSPGRSVTQWFLLFSTILAKMSRFSQLKHNPFFMYSVHFSAVNASTSIVFRSLFWKFHFFRGSSLAFSGCFPFVILPSILCIFQKLLSRCAAHSYHSLRFLGGVGRSRSFRWSGIFNVLLK